VGGIARVSGIEISGQGRFDAVRAEEFVDRRGAIEGQDIIEGYAVAWVEKEAIERVGIRLRFCAFRERRCADKSCDDQRKSGGGSDC
jgi:hypothetical protein